MAIIYIIYVPIIKTTHPIKTTVLKIRYPLIKLIFHPGGPTAPGYFQVDIFHSVGFHNIFHVTGSNHG